MNFLVDEKNNSAKYYGVGYCPKLDKYILFCVVTWIAWHNRYYEITPDEYEAFGQKEIDDLADELYKQGCASERFLFSDKKEENNEAQDKMRNELCSENWQSSRASRKCCCAKRIYNSKNFISTYINLYQLISTYIILYHLYYFILFGFIYIRKCSDCRQKK